jgi:hypothetical protein
VKFVVRNYSESHRMNANPRLHEAVKERYLSITMARTVEVDHVVECR